MPTTFQKDVDVMRNQALNYLSAYMHYLAISFKNLESIAKHNQ
jgi:hypothetical protein